MAQLTPEAYQRLIAAGATPEQLKQKASEFGYELPNQGLQDWANKSPESFDKFADSQGRGTRQAPTVATPTQPVINKSYSESLPYDQANPEDYLMRLNARLTATGKKPNETEYYNAMLAQKALQEQQKKSSMVLPADMIAEQAAQREAEITRDKEALKAYRESIAGSYEAQRARTREVGEKSKTAAQNVYSFSGFGRSTAAANKLVDIEKSTGDAISAIDKAEQAEIEKRRLELAGADSDSLKGINDQIAAFRKAAADYQVKALTETENANKASGASYMESINNLMLSAGKSGISLGNPEDIQKYAQMARNADGTINEEFIATLPPTMQAMIRSANTTAAGDYQFIPATKTQKAGYFDKNTGKFVPIDSTAGKRISSSMGSTKTAPQIQQEGSALNLVDYNSVKFKNDPQTTAFTYATRMIEASDIFNELEDQIVGQSKGEYILQKSLGKLPYGSSMQSGLMQQQEQAERNFVNAVLRKESGAAIAPSEFESAQKQYLPQPGDSEAVLEQKRKNRLTAIRGISASSGNIKALQPAINKIATPKKKVATPAKKDPLGLF